MVNIITETSVTFDKNFSVSQYFFRYFNRTHDVLLGYRRDKKMYPPTAHYRSDVDDHDYVYIAFDVDNYLLAFTEKLKKMTDVNGEKYWSDIQINDLVSMERHLDGIRENATKIQERLLVSLSLDYYGAYVHKHIYIGYVENKHGVKNHAFLVSGFAIRCKGGTGLGYVLSNEFRKSFDKFYKPKRKIHWHWKAIESTFAHLANDNSAQNLFKSACLMYIKHIKNSADFQENTLFMCHLLSEMEK